MEFRKSKLTSLPDMINPIEEAKVYYSYGRFDQAFDVLHNAIDTIQTSRVKIAFEDYYCLAENLVLLFADKFMDQKDVTCLIDFILKPFHEHTPYYNDLLKMIRQHTTESQEKVNDEIKPTECSLKERMIDRLVCLSKQCNLPGFDDTPEKIQAKFLNMPDDLFMTMFELIVIQAHRDGHQ